jgi:hypothetical protein
MACAAGQELLLDRIDGQLQPLPPLEKLYVLKFAENRITKWVGDAAKDPENQKNPVWVLKVISFSYAALGHIYARHFSELTDVFRERSELYADFVRGKLRLKELEPLEKENEKRKADELSRAFSKLSTKEREPTEARAQFLLKAGDELGLMIATHGAISTTKK